MIQWCDLVKADTDASRKFSQYRSDSEEFAALLLGGLEKYLGCARTSYAVVPPEGDANQGSIYSIPGAMQLADDSFWHLGVKLLLPSRHLLIPFLFKKVGAEWNLKLGEDGRQFRVSGMSVEEMEPIYAHLSKNIIDWMENGLQRFLQQGTHDRLGFK